MHLLAAEVGSLLPQNEAYWPVLTEHVVLLYSN